MGPRFCASTATGAYANQQFTFKVFNNAALTSQVGSTQYLSPGRSFSITLDPDRTYYVAEVAENGWNCTTPGVSTKTVNGVDTTTFVLPYTGSTAMRLLPAFSALCMLCGIALLAYRRKLAVPLPGAFSLLPALLRLRMALPSTSST